MSMGDGCILACRKCGSKIRTDRKHVDKQIDAHVWGSDCEAEHIDVAVWWV